VAASPTLSPPTQSQPQSQADAALPLRLWHLTSLDAPTVAVVWCLAFAWTARVALPIWLPTVLALAAWSFYIADRLLDARRELEVDPRARMRTAESSLLRPRHHFHWRHRRIFIPVCIAAVSCAMALVWRSMPAVARERNSLLAAAAIVYFSTVHSPWRPSRADRRLPKELLVGILFTLACALPAWSRMAAHPAVLIAPVLMYITLAWLNCLGIEAWESGVSGRYSIFRRALALAATALAAALVSAALHQARPAWLLAAAALSAGLLGLLDVYRRRLAPTTLRATADLVLLTPLALLLLP